MLPHPLADLPLPFALKVFPSSANARPPPHSIYLVHPHAGCYNLPGMGIRLVVGRQTLNLQAVVRIHDPQPGQRHTVGRAMQSWPWS